MTYLTPGQHIHFIGIGGVGLSAIARVLLQKGYGVSGSDRASNDYTRALDYEGATIYEGHAAHNVDGADAVIVTSAAASDHVEIAAARAQNIPVYKRSDIIADVTQGQNVVAIAGSHGKTTTTAMTAHILSETGRHPSYIIGGTLATTGSNANFGTGDSFVIEADEYDNMFLGLRPQTAVITNVEWDHPDFFPTPEDFQRSFTRFADLLPEDGLLITCGDDPVAFEMAYARRGAGLPAATYSLMDAPFSGNRGRVGRGRAAGRSLISEMVDQSPQGLWRGVNLRTQAGGTVFELLHWGTSIGTIRLQLPGRHNALNAMAAIIAAYSQGVPPAEGVAALATFEGTGRRFDLRGEVDGVAVIDDYAHHPTAIRVNVQAVRQRYPDCEVWAVWQPHTYSRMQALWNDYLTAFADADHVLVTDIYAAREQPIPEVNSAAFVSDIYHRDARHTPSLNDAVAVLDANVFGPAVILIMSAGDAPQIGIDFLKRRQSRSTNNPSALAPR